jgi:C4-dicarboxylate-specific signal transduction histidine kinase
VAEEDRSRFADSWQALATAPHESHFEERVSTTEGWRCIAWSQKAMLDAQGAIAAVVAVGRDVTERLRAEERGRRHLQQLAHVGRISAMGEMASAIAHEVNQPLTALRTYAQACQRLLASGAEPQDLSDTLGRISTLAERASEIIRRLRGFMARDEARMLPVDPNDIVSEVIGLARAEASQCGVQLNTRLAEGLPLVEVDRIQIEQVLLNLVRNGIEAMQQARSAGRRLLVSTRLEAGEVLLSVQDSGPGVAPEAADSIFEAFVSGKPGGMGIGLAISRSIAEAHHGRLWLDPDFAPGALFHLGLPALTAAASRAREE